MCVVEGRATGVFQVTVGFLHNAGEEEKGSEWVRKSQREAKIEEIPRCAPEAGSKTMGKRKSSLFIS